MALLAGALLLPGCWNSQARFTGSGEPVSSPDLSAQAKLLGSRELLDRPLLFRRENDLYACGLASMDMLCRYHGVDLPEAKKQELRDLAKKKEGVSGAELKAVLESLGFEVFIFKGALDRSPTGLYHHLDRERPVLVMTSRDGKGFHYQILMGYDEERGNLILYDQKRGTVLSAKPDFAKHWASANCFALLAVPKRAGETGGRTGVGSGEEKR